MYNYFCCYVLFMFMVIKIYLFYLLDIIIYKDKLSINIFDELEKDSK
jgi:hypothetical protein